MAKIGNFEVLVGCDPEFWVKKKGTQKIISAQNLVNGTKNNPFPLNKGSVQVSGKALEINILPVKTIKGFNGNINKVFDSLNKLLPDYDFVFNPVAEIEQTNKLSSLGAEPEYNAYTKTINPPSTQQGIETAGGHIHISWKNDQDVNWPAEINPTEATHFEACCMLTKALDAYLGIPSLVWDRDLVRRSIDGKPGNFRPKCYGDGWFGMEYRSLSNAWLNLQSTRDLVYGNTIDAFTALMKDEEVQDSVWYGHTAKHLLENPTDKALERVVVNVITGSANKVKGPKYYRLQREKAVA
jgi:hypothetical protein